MNSYVNKYFTFWKLMSDQALKYSLLNTHVYFVQQPYLVYMFNFYI